MDDLILFDNSKDQLNQWKEAIRKYLQSLKLELHARKCQIYLVRNGVPFLGYKIYPTHRLVLTDNIKRFRKRLKRYLKGSGGGGLAMHSKIQSSFQSWLGYALHADSYHLRHKLLLEFEKGISPKK